tara:strand:- start:1084 stop:1965 length:882 start_codon:yes stop_codon:yes gene_type:complete
VGFSADPLPPIQPEWTARLTRSLSLIPSGYSPAIFLDVQAALANAGIQESLDLEVLGLLDTLQPGASASVDSAVVAFSRHRDGMIMVIQGSLDVDGLLAAAGGLGLVELGQEPEKHRDYDIQSVDVFDISLALASVDGSSLLIATGSPSVGATGPERIRTALDSFDGLVTGLLDDPETSRMVRELPPGMMAMVLGNCANLTVLFHSRTLQGCTRAVISSELAETGSGAINAIVGYENEAQASTAMELMGEQGFQLDGVTLENVAMVQERSLLRLKLPANADQVATAFETLRLP